MLPARIPLVLWLCLSGCQDLDYQLNHPEEGWGPTEAYPPVFDLPLRISFDVAFQRNNWGLETTRCQVQVALYLEEEYDGLGMGSSPMEQRIEMPEEAGECVLTILPDPDPNQGEEWGDGDIPDSDNWRVRGSVEAGEVIYLRGQEDNYPLVRIEDEEGKVYYALEDCQADNFPFGEVMDLVTVLGNEDHPLYGFCLEDAFGVGPDMQIQVPAVEGVSDRTLEHSVEEALTLSWAYDGPIPEIRGEALKREEVVLLMNGETEDFLPRRVIACMPLPEEAGIVLDAELLNSLLVNEEPANWDYHTAIQVDSRYSSPERMTDWGEVLRVGTTVSDGGIANFYTGSW